ncbi:diiron oxygenase [Mycobacteroides abscessus]|uniref:diiron oxygenase n=1 Tax=Mycobacteroides abscessus TaxID=36809 RepID=UPI0018965C6F
MPLFTVPKSGAFDAEYLQALQTLSEGSVRLHFDPFEDIDWDSPDYQIDRNDPRWVLDPELDTLGATEWYRNQPLERQIEIGRWRQANAVKVGLAFESILIRGMMQYLMKLPNGSPEFRYCLHEMTEECNHIQMFQELVNRIGDDVPGMRKWFRRASPFIGVLGGWAHVVLFIGILGGEEPIDHYQKSLIRNDIDQPPAVRRVMQIHVAEEARHISFAGEFLRVHVPLMSKRKKAICTVLFPLTMRWLAGEIMTPPRSFATEFDIPREVFKEAFWRSEHARNTLSGYFGDMRKLTEDIGLRPWWVRPLWKLLHIDGRPSRYRSEPDRSHAGAPLAVGA